MKIGSIAFANSLPVDLALVRGAVRFSGEFVHGTPDQLNEKMGSGELDAGPVSALWYGQNQKRLLLLPDLSISSESAVDSVLLFSRVPVRKLRGKKIWVTPKGRTTPGLLEILCRELYGFRPKLETYSETPNPADTEAILLIGDEALQWKEQHSDGFIVTDLAERWKNWTGLPFVFAVWVVRKAFWKENADKVMALCDSFQQSKEWGAAHPEVVLEEAMRRTGLQATTLGRYFDKLSFDFGPDLRQGLRSYLQYAKRFGWLHEVGELEEVPRPVTAEEAQ